jgi:tetratricopeptide (TPR) repeat protein
MSVWIAPALSVALALASADTPPAGRETLTDRAATEVVGVVGTDATGSGSVLVMPFENVKREGRIFWLGEAASVLLTDDLASLGVNAIERSARQQAFDRLQVPPAATLTEATVIRIGQLVGADRVVIGTLQLEGETLIVRARSIALEAGRVQADVTERGALADLYGMFERLAERMTPSPSQRADAGERRQPPVAAFENYIKGLLAETPENARGYLNAALRLYPAFDRARLALWDTYTDEGDYDKALATIASVRPESSYARRARFLAGLSQLDLRKYDDAFATFKALADERAEPAVLSNLGVVQVRRGGAFKSSQAMASSAPANSASSFFSKAAEADPGDSDYVFNLGYAYWLDRDTQAAIYWLREAVRRRPADGVAHYVLGTALGAAGHAAEASREKELARRLSSQYGEWDRRPAGDPIPKGLERVKSEVELPHAREIQSKLASSEQRDQRELAQFYLESGRRLFERENDRDATAELNRALYLSPYLADAHLLLGRILLRNGRAREAIDAFKISLWSAETAAAHAALGEAYLQDKDPTRARAEADRALALDPSLVEAQALVARLNGR